MNTCRETWPGHPLEERTTWGIFQPPMVKDYYGSKGFEPFLIFCQLHTMRERKGESQQQPLIKGLMNHLLLGVLVWGGWLHSYLLLSYALLANPK